MRACSRDLIVTICLAFLLSTLVFAQASQETSKEKSDKKAKEEKPKDEKKGGNPIKAVTGVFGGKSEAEKAEKAEKNAVKRKKEYQKFRENGQKKYDADTAFKARVDQDYKDVRRRHSEYA